MEKIKCSCGDPECKIEITYISGADGNVEFWFIDKEGHENLMFLDPNGAVELIKKLKSAIIKLIS